MNYTLKVKEKFEFSVPSGVHIWLQFYRFTCWSGIRGWCKNGGIGVHIVAQQKRIQLVYMRIQVQSLALLSGLKIRHCHELW